MAQALAARLAPRASGQEPRATAPAPGRHRAAAPPCRLPEVAAAVVGRFAPQARLPARSVGEGHPPYLARRGAAAAQTPEAQDQAVPQRGQAPVAALRADLYRHQGLMRYPGVVGAG